MVREVVQYEELLARGQTAAPLRGRLTLYVNNDEIFKGEKKMFSLMRSRITTMKEFDNCKNENSENKNKNSETFLSGSQVMPSVVFFSPTNSPTPRDIQFTMSYQRKASNCHI